MTSDKKPALRETRDMRAEAQKLNDQGRRLVVLRPDSKLPKSKAWQNSDPKPHEFGLNDNIGVQPGAKSGHLVDLDFDCRPARVLSGLGCFFRDAPSFRRQSLSENAPGHRLVICRDAPDTVEKFGFTRKGEKEVTAVLGLPKSVLLEIRAGKCYTAVPPSIFDGDPLVCYRLRRTKPCARRRP